MIKQSLIINKWHSGVLNINKKFTMIAIDGYFGKSINCIINVKSIKKKKKKRKKKKKEKKVPLIFGCHTFFQISK